MISHIPYNPLTVPVDSMLELEKSIENTVATTLRAAAGRGRPETNTDFTETSDKHTERVYVSCIPEQTQPNSRAARRQAEREAKQKTHLAFIQVPFAKKQEEPAQPTYLYKCDPELNVDCAKTNCFLNGGECSATYSLMHAKKPIEKVTMMIDMNKEDAEAFGCVVEGDDE